MTRKNQVTSVSASAAADERIKEITQLLKQIGTEMDKYRSLYHKDWGHVGDLGYVEEQLGQVWEFIAETDS